jgi:hypothetical protein
VRPAQFPGTCCRCARPFGVGASISGRPGMWAHEPCLDLGSAPLPPAGSDAEVLEILARARIVRDTAEAADRIRARRAEGSLF